MEFKQLSLRQAGEFDAQVGAKSKLTGWGIVSKDRRERGISRKAKRLLKKQQGETK